MQNSVEDTENKRLDCEACQAKECVRLICHMAAISSVDVAEAMVNDYGIWPKEVVPCIDKRVGRMIFKVHVGKAKINEIVKKPPCVKGIWMTVDDCRDELTHEYDIRGCNVCFSDNEIRSFIK